MYTKIQGNLRKNNKTQAYSTPPFGPGPGPGSRGCCRLVYYCFPLGFLVCWYPYAHIRLEIIIRLDLIPNVCIIIPVGLYSYYPYYPYYAYHPYYPNYLYIEDAYGGSSPHPHTLCPIQCVWGSSSHPTATRRNGEQEQKLSQKLSRSV